MSAEEKIVKDIIVVGSGCAGFSAALEACSAGASVAVVEKEAVLGGTSITSGGGCFVVCSPLQESLGFKDSADMAFDDWVKWSKGTADEQWARFYIEHSLHELYFWAEGLGVKWVDMKPQEGNRVSRWTRCENNGLGLMTALMTAARGKGLKEIHTDTEITQILTRDGAVAGVKGVNRTSGNPLEFQAKAVIMATGGFGSNLDMIHEMRPDLKDSKIMEGSGAGANGNGHKIVLEAGGYLTHMDQIWFYIYATPDYRDSENRRGLVFRHTPGYIWVNQQGRRFHNESLSGGASATPALLSQSPRHAWAVMDTPMTAKMEVADPYYREGDHILREKIQELLDNSPYIRKADSLEALGRKIEVDVPTFLSTIENYNQAVESGNEHDPEFGKPLNASKVFDTPPFYAVQLFPLARKTLGGAKTDIQCRVLNKHFEPIPGLYAAGEVAGMAGGHINGCAGLEGTMLGPSVISGRVAGAWAAADIGYGKGFVGKSLRP